MSRRFRLTLIVLFFGFASSSWGSSGFSHLFQPDYSNFTGQPTYIPYAATPYAGPVHPYFAAQTLPAIAPAPQAPGPAFVDYWGTPAQGQMVYPPSNMVYSGIEPAPSIYTSENYSDPGTFTGCIPTPASSGRSAW